MNLHESGLLQAVDHICDDIASGVALKEPSKLRLDAGFEKATVNHVWLFKEQSFHVFYPTAGTASHCKRLQDSSNTLNVLMFFGVYC